MDEIKEKDRFIRRLNKTTSFIKEKTRIEKIRRLIEYLYGKDIFVSIPIELFDMSDLSEVLRYEKIVNRYFDSGLLTQVIPDGILGLEESPELYVKNNMITKFMNKGIVMDFSFVPNAIKVRMGKMLDEVKDVYEKNLLLKKCLVKYSTSNIRSKNEYAKRKNILIEEYRQNNPNATSNDIASMYEDFFKEQMHQFEFVETEYNSKMSLDVETFIKNKFFRYDPKEILEIENANVSESRRETVANHFEEQKKYLINVLKNLSRNGTLKELVDSENESIRKMNVLFSKENKIDDLTEDDIFDRVRSFDCTKKDDVLEMLIYIRHFSNKLAHNFEDYIFANIVMNSVSDEEFINLKQNKPGIIKQEILDLYDKWKLDAIKQKELSEAKKDANNEVPEKKHLNIQTRSIRETTFREVAKKYGIENGLLKSVLKVGNPNARQALENKKIEFLAGFDSKEDYAYYVFKEIRRLRNEYNSVFSKSSNDISSGSFKDFVKSAFLRRTEFAKDFRSFKISETKKDLATELLMLIERIEKEEVIKNPDKTFLFIVGQLDLIENIYDVKHFATMQILEEHHNNPQKIKMENKKPAMRSNKKENGAVDIYIDGSHQIWGGHYTIGDFESLNQYIQSLDSPSENINNAFLLSNDSESLKTFVPQKKLSATQINEMRKDLEILNAINDGRWIDDHGTGKYGEFWKIKNENPDFFNSLRIRAALGSGLKIFTKQYFDRNNATTAECTLTESEKEFAENFVQIAIESGFSINDIEKGTFIGLRNPELIDYCKREYTKKMSVLQSRE